MVRELGLGKIKGIIKGISKFEAQKFNSVLEEIYLRNEINCSKTGQKIAATNNQTLFIFTIQKFLFYE